MIKKSSHFTFGPYIVDILALLQMIYMGSFFIFKPNDFKFKDSDVIFRGGSMFAASNIEYEAKIF